jgi:hypothetical protein
MTTAPKPFATPTFTPSVLRYIGYLLSLASGRNPPPREIEKFMNEVFIALMAREPSTILRQRSLPERGG